MSITISMQDIIIAYRKAKADAFYDHGHLTSLKFAQYEENLQSNLSAFDDKINRKETSWLEEEDFTGTYTFTLKKVEPDKKEADETSGFFFYSSSERNWKNVSKVTADFRLIGLHSVEFHILSSLWIEKVGQFLEEKMSINCYGCRLKRSANVEDEVSPDFIYTPTANRKEKTYVGHFRPYLRDYQEWQYKGITKIKKALSEGRKIVAVTSDFAKYYHRIDCSFIQTEDFLQYLKVNDYSPLQRKLTNLLVKAIKAWSDLVYRDERVPAVFKHNGHCGVPMGIGASKVIANLLLTFFDKAVEKEIKPIYYGRYVDDIFLVIEDGDNIITADDFWEFLRKRIDNITIAKHSKKKASNELSLQEYMPENHTVDVPYSKGSLLEFSKGKEKYFFLEGKGGEAFLKTLKESLDEHSSEWKLPPDSEEDVENFSEAMTDASRSSSESANGLRKSDGLSIQRMKFILYLKRFEVAIDLLPKKVWQKALKDFFKVVSEYTITAETIGSFSRYYPRVLSLAVKAKDREALAEIYSKTLETYKELGTKENGGNIESDDFQYCITKATDYQKRLLLEGIYSSLDPSLSEEQLDSIIDGSIKRGLGRLNLLRAAKKLFFSDLHQKAFKEAFIHHLESTSFSENVFSLFDNFQFRFEDPPHYKEFSTLVKQLSKASKLKNISSTSPPKALYFYTRPFTILELTIVFPNWLKLPNTFKAICDFYHIVWEHPKKIQIDKLKDSSDYKAYQIKSPYKNSNRSFALTSLETKNESWIAIVREDGFEPDINRTQRILDLARDIVTCSKEINYVVFPELSLPRKLLLYLSGLFLFRKISLIAGFEYQNLVGDTSGLPATSKGFVSNQLIYILCVSNDYGLHQVSLRQEKVLPALEEERLLFDVGGKHMKAVNQHKLLINHDNFWFSGLICNDFLNIDNRAILRGLIDALIVIEWNKDVNTYNALVEASANDIHTFVLQINNRLYGDTRLRAPYKEDFRRDVVRVRGGELDYFVVATLEVKELRKFQSSHRSPEKPFKPVPTGFEILPERKYSSKDVNEDETHS